MFAVFNSRSDQHCEKKFSILNSSVIFFLQDVRDLCLRNGGSACQDLLLLVLGQRLLLLVRLHGTATKLPDTGQASGPVLGAEAEVDDGVRDQRDVGGPDEQDLVLELVGQHVQLLEAHGGLHDPLQLDNVHRRSEKKKWLTNTGPRSAA